MLATRGAVYKTQRTAGDGNKYHRRCRCRAELETDFDAREDIAISPEDANRQIGFRGASRDYAYDMSDFRIKGVTDPPRVPRSAPVKPRKVSLKRYKVGRDTHVVRNQEILDLVDVDQYRADRATLGALEKQAAGNESLSRIIGPRIEQLKRSVAEAEERQRKALASRPGFNPNNPLEFYGDMLQISGDSRKVRDALKQIESLPREVHETLRNHFLGSDRGGFYIGDAKGVPDLDDLGSLAGVRPRGYADGSTWDAVGGAYSPVDRVVAVATEGRDGSVSVALHETAHSLDDAYRGRGQFDAVWSGVADKSKPYFNPSGNPAGWQSEGWAESLAAYWVPGNSRAKTVRLVSDAMGIPADDAKRVVDYFDSWFSQGSQAT
jgi:hypothetical protein